MNNIREMPKDDPNSIFITYKSKPMFSAELKHMQSCYIPGGRDGFFRGTCELYYIVFTGDSIMNEEATAMITVIRLLFLQSLHVPKCLGEIIAVIRVPTMEDGKSIRSYYQNKLLPHAVTPSDPQDTPYLMNTVEISKMLEGVKIINIDVE